MLAVIAGDYPRRARKEPTDEELIAQLRADLIAERAQKLRLAEYIDEVLGAEVPDDAAVAGWERDDWRDYWSERAEWDLKQHDWWRRAFWKRSPPPVMGPQDEADKPELLA